MCPGTVRSLVSVRRGHGTARSRLGTASWCCCHGIVRRHCHGTADIPHPSRETLRPQKQLSNNKVSFKEQDLKFKIKGCSNCDDD